MSNVDFPPLVKFNLLFLGVGKLIMVTLSRSFYPYAVYLTDAFDVTPNHYSWILFAGEASAFLVMLTGGLVDILGAKFASVVCMLGLSFASFLTLTRVFALVVLARAIIGIARNTMITSIQTYISEHVPRSSLGRITGAMELSWGLGGLVGLPLMGMLMSYGWRTPFFVIGFAFLPLALFELCGSGKPVRSASLPKSVPTSFPQSPSGEVSLALSPIGVREMLLQHNGVALCLLLWVCLQVFAVNLLFANYGRWFVEEYELTRLQLGGATSAVGCGEIGAELIVMLLSDRVGRSRLCLLCTGLNVLSFGALVCIGRFGAPLPVSVCFLFMCFLFFETGLVSAFSVPSTLVQGRVKGRFIGMFFGMLPVGGSMSALVAQSLWSGGGLTLTATCSCLAAVLGFVILIPVYLRNDSPISETPSVPTESSFLKAGSCA